MSIDVAIEQKEASATSGEKNMNPQIGEGKLPLLIEETIEAKYLTS